MILAELPPLAVRQERRVRSLSPTSQPTTDSWDFGTFSRDTMASMGNEEQDEDAAELPVLLPSARPEHALVGTLLMPAISESSATPQETAVPKSKPVPIPVRVRKSSIRGLVASWTQPSPPSTSASSSRWGKLARRGSALFLPRPTQAVG